MRPKNESTITSWKSRANNLIVLVEFFLKFASNNGFQLFLDVLLKRSLGLNWHLTLKCLRTRIIFVSII